MGVLVHRQQHGTCLRVDEDDVVRVRPVDVHPPHQAAGRRATGAEHDRVVDPALGPGRRQVVGGQPTLGGDVVHGGDPGGGRCDGGIGPHVGRGGRQVRERGAYVAGVVELDRRLATEHGHAADLLLEAHGGAGAEAGRGAQRDQVRARGAERVAEAVGELEPGGVGVLGLEVDRSAGLGAQRVDAAGDRVTVELDGPVGGVAQGLDGLPGGGVVGGRRRLAVHRADQW